MDPEEKRNELLIRLDERTRTIKSDIEEIKGEVYEMRSSFKKDMEKYVTKEQFAPMLRAIYSVVTFIVITIFATVINFIIKGH